MVALTITGFGCAVVGLIGALIGIMFVAVVAMIVDWITTRH